jgi:hypothetical protein
MNAIANYNKCKKYMNKFVRIHTSNGIYTGKIVKLDKQNVYLKVSSKRDGKKVHTSFFPLIFPLFILYFIYKIIFYKKIFNLN